jgi:hypothetical protein
MHAQPMLSKLPKRSGHDTATVRLQSHQHIIATAARERHNSLQCCGHSQGLLTAAAAACETLSTLRPHCTQHQWRCCCCCCCCSSTLFPARAMWPATNTAGMLYRCHSAVTAAAPPGAATTAAAAAAEVLMPSSLRTRRTLGLTCQTSRHPTSCCCCCCKGTRSPSLAP